MTLLSYVKSEIKILHVFVLCTHLCILDVFIKFIAHYLSHSNYTVNASLSILLINLILVVSKL